MRRPALTLALRAVSLFTAFVIAAGCSAPPAMIEPTMRIVSLLDYDEFVDQSLTTLRLCHLEPRFVDRTSGLIVSQPTTSAQWFEFWRVDAPGGYQLLESSMHTIRRIVTIRIDPVETDRKRTQPRPPAAALSPSPPSPLRPGAAPLPPAADAPERYRLTVEVQKERFSSPERQVTTASSALGIYNERLPTTEGLRGAASRSDHWVSLGRDGRLELCLIDRLTADYHAETPPPTASSN